VTERSDRRGSSGDSSSLPKERRHPGALGLTPETTELSAHVQRTVKAARKDKPTLRKGSPLTCRCGMMPDMTAATSRSDPHHAPKFGYFSLPRVMAERMRGFPGA